MQRFELHGKVELNGAGCPAVDFCLTVPADDETQARAAVEPLLGRWPHLVMHIDRQEPGCLAQIKEGRLRGVFNARSPRP